MRKTNFGCESQNSVNLVTFFPNAVYNKKSRSINSCLQREEEITPRFHVFSGIHEIWPGLNFKIKASQKKDLTTQMHRIFLIVALEKQTKEGRRLIGCSLSTKGLGSIFSFSRMPPNLVYRIELANFIVDGLPKS